MKFIEVLLLVVYMLVVARLQGREEVCGSTADNSEASLSALGYSIDQLELLVVFEGNEHVEV